MKGKRAKAVTVVSVGGCEHFAICWASGSLGAESIKVVRDTHLVLMSRAKQPGTQAVKKLKEEVIASIKINRSSVIIVALYQKESGVSEKAQTKKLFRAMQIVKSWGLPIEDDKMMGIRFEGEGVEMQAATWKYMQQISTL